MAKMDPHIRVLPYTPNTGKGYEVRQGVLQSHGDAGMFFGGGLDISRGLINDYVERLSASDLVVATRRHPKSNIAITSSRTFLSRAFDRLTLVATGMNMLVDVERISYKYGTAHSYQHEYLKKWNNNSLKRVLTT